MVTRAQDRLRVLFVNDESSELRFLSESVRRNGTDVLDVETFGPEDAGGMGVGVAFLGMLQSLSDGQGPNADIVFLDYAMDGGMNGIQVLENIEQHLPDLDLPIVLITKNDMRMMEEAVRATEFGARGYVFVGRETLAREIEVTAQRVFREKQRERWAAAVMEIASRASELASARDYERVVFDPFSEQNASLKVFVRELSEDGHRLLLRAHSANIPEESLEELRSLQVDDFPTLQEAVASNAPTVYNSLPEVFDETHKTYVDVCSALGLWRGMTIPISKSSGRVIGTISMYRRLIDPPFNHEDKKYAGDLARSIETALEAGRRATQGRAHAKFIEQFGDPTDEDALCARLVSHLHTEINRAAADAQSSKTTFKRLVPGSEYLVCEDGRGHHLGAPREAWTPRVSDSNSVSCQVALSNRPILVGDMKAMPHDSRKLTHQQMRSELCLPVSASRVAGAPVMGVLNLEHNDPHFYTEDDEEYAYALCGLVGQRLELMRVNRFLSEILQAVSVHPSADGQVNNAIAIVRRLTGCCAVAFLFGDGIGEPWRLAGSDTADGRARETFSRDIENYLQSKARTEDDRLRRMLDEDRSLPSGMEPLSSLNEPLTNGNAVKASAFPMLVGDGIVGVMYMEFMTENALSATTEALVAQFASWIGWLYLQDERHSDLYARNNMLLHEAAFARMASDIVHRYRTVTERMDVEISKACSSPTAAASTERMAKRLAKLLQQLKSIPRELSSVAGPTKPESTDAAGTTRSVVDELYEKATDGDVAVSVRPSVEAYVFVDPRSLAMCIETLVDNAIDASVNAEVRIVDISITSQGAGHVRIQVDDSGEGVAAHVDVETLFGPGVTTKPDGLGWGLYWARKMAEDMGGTLELVRRNVGMQAVLEIRTSVE